MICIFACVIERFCAQGGGYGVPEHQRDEEEESSADCINIANLTKFSARIEQFLDFRAPQFRLMNFRSYATRISKVVEAYMIFYTSFLGEQDGMGQMFLTSHRLQINGIKLAMRVLLKWS